MRRRNGKRKVRRMWKRSKGRGKKEERYIRRRRRM